ncbi:hypothetical protein GLYMA_13G164500v4 [Glycine max]|uniref:Uncharacterized protein n=1 Tax=Glycine max TaxID=3847 RepID=K7M073_SOYBN|nr:hypothetical protein JHK85_037216 [Glycine max]KAH1101895.1 hypothetical protein GYH30_036435 [Glycine max]KRH20232.1 hypothetical protein GLYMA_13G164500v4 [Glycine max]
MGNKDETWRNGGRLGCCCDAHGGGDKSLHGLVGFGRGGPLGSWSYDRKHGHDGIHGLNNKLIRQKIEGIIHNLG